ncbi:DUF2339 domain-containing protein [Vibrio lamellibrachiae]|uniref:DUF2339 domain-containing protein n=1 Tax=Vibrio lamellibrachiae TaxID=2910253 RepID=UPI003D0CFEFF
MDFTLILIVIAAIFCFLLYGAALGIEARNKVNKLTKRIVQLEQRLSEQSDDETASRERNIDALSPSAKSSPNLVSEDIGHSVKDETEKIANFQASELVSANAISQVDQQDGVHVSLGDGSDEKPTGNLRSTWQMFSGLISSFNIKDNGLYWLGGVILAFGGLFLAKYTLESGLLSPVARVLLGFTTGIGLIIAAEYLTQKKERFNIQGDYISAALVSGGVITCYAMTLVASHYYQLISPTFAFITLAIIALTATAMTLRYGPIVAVIGILGAYSVPLPFWHLDYSVLAIAGYIVLVSASAIFVANRIRLNWLWWLSFVAHFSWFFIMVVLGGKGEALTIVLFSLVSLYLYVLSDILGWKLQQVNFRPMPINVLLMPRKEQVGLLASLLPIWLFYYVYGYQPSLILTTVAILALLCAAPLRHSAFDTWPILGWLFSIATLWMLLPEADYNDLDFVFTGAHLYSQAIALALFSYALYAQRLYPERLAFSLLLVVAPSSLFALCYIFSPPQANLAMYSLWAVELALLAFIAERLTAKHDCAWVKLSGLLLVNVHVSLILTMLLESSTLTLALSMQVVGLGYWCHRLILTPPPWLVKTLLSILLVRLTLFPWLDGYSDELLFGFHWTIIIYPLIIALLFSARRYYQDTNLSQIISGAILHVTALLVTTESSYQLVGSYPDLISPSFHEAILLAMNWLIMAAVYCYRSQYSQSLRMSYLGFAVLLTIGASYYHLGLLTFNNPWVFYLSIGEWSLLNWMLPLWLIPTLVVLVTSRLPLFQSKQRVIMYSISALWLLQFINGTIRHQFHDDVISLSLSTQELEMYAYSLVWLLISIGCLLFASRYTAPLISKVGFGILAVVVCKAFLIDMSQLTGLYRALSFLGLGISLLGVGWLFQKLKETHSIE